MSTHGRTNGTPADEGSPPPTTPETSSRRQPGGQTRQRVAPGRLSLFLDVERGWMVTIVALVLLVLVPLASPASTPLLTTGLIFLLMAYSWNIVGGFLGEMSFAHMIFWGLGGYGLVLAVNAGKPLILWVIAMMVLAALTGAVVAGLIRAVRLEGLLPVSIFTLVLGQIAFTWVVGSKKLGGSEGLIVAALPTVSTYVMFLSLGLLVAVAALVNVAIANARKGRKLLAIRDDAVAAQVAGINVALQRYSAYLLSAALFAVGGAYQAYYTGSASPDNMLGIAPLIMVSLAIFVGGPGTAMGPLLGTLIIFGVQAAALQASDSPNVSLWAQLIAFGAAVLLLRLVTPRLKGLDMATALVRSVSNRRRGQSGVTDSLIAAADTTQFVDAALSRGAEPGGVGTRTDQTLTVSDVHKSFGALKVLRGVSFSIEPGEVVGIVGPNGAGKSTLCNLISGVERVTSGSITLGGNEVTRIPIHQRSAHGMGRSFQTPRLFPSLSLPENLSLARGHLSELDAEEILGEMGIVNSRRRRGDDSQFFARRLTEVMKAAMQGSAILMLDEPLAGLTAEEQKIVLGLARRAAEKGACVAIVEHLIPVLAPAVDRIVVLDGGRIVADGVPEFVLQQDEVVEAYLGKPHKMEDAS